MGRAFDFRSVKLLDASPSLAVRECLIPGAVGVRDMQRPQYVPLPSGEGLGVGRSRETGLSGFTQKPPQMSSRGLFPGSIPPLARKRRRWEQFQPPEFAARWIPGTSPGMTLNDCTKLQPATLFASSHRSFTAACAAGPSPEGRGLTRQPAAHGRHVEHVESRSGAAI